MQLDLVAVLEDQARQPERVELDCFGVMKIAQRVVEKDGLWTAQYLVHEDGWESAIASAEGASYSDALRGLRNYGVIQRSGRDEGTLRRVAVLLWMDFWAAKRGSPITAAEYMDVVWADLCSRHMDNQWLIDFKKGL